MFEISLSVNQSNQRLDRVLARYLKSAPKSFIYKMLRKKNITLNGEKAVGNEKTVAGDRIQFFFSQETYDKMRGGDAAIPVPNADFPEIPVLYEDSDVLIFVKPQGILSQKASANDFSVNEWVLFRAQEKGLYTISDYALFKPSVANRLDRNTGGIMCAGLSEPGLQALSEMFRVRSVQKYYLALVKGDVEEPKEICGYLLKDEKTNKVRIYQSPYPGAKEIRTAFTPVRRYGDRTLLFIDLLTGRSHQIRAHLSSLGHPILGDTKYGDNRFNIEYGRFRQCLFACRLTFPDPCALPQLSGRTFNAEVPEDWPLGDRGA